MEKIGYTIRLNMCMVYDAFNEMINYSKSLVNLLENGWHIFTSQAQFLIQLLLTVIWGWWEDEYYVECWRELSFVYPFALSCGVWIHSIGNTIVAAGMNVWLLNSNEFKMMLKFKSIKASERAKKVPKENTCLIFDINKNVL